MVIKNVDFVISNSDYRKCPQANLPEFAFIGRSNVGKSSLINMLMGRKNLAKTSSQPGKTQLINHFIVNNQWYLVDLPGYGYARTSQTNRQKWSKMIEQYILNRENLISTFVLIDSRIEVQKSDIEFINFLGTNNKPFSIIFTKSDKQSTNQTSKNIARFKQELLRNWAELPKIFVSSSINKDGREEILTEINDIIGYF
ncbi:MAG: ribosome biogenesis GTP-binding protein YihA/YsxC [Bacteroidales bacterium]|jgi:GTP-binding protein|nr:ribosome biogenesis GTP-binding protein YihA/YsxC [Bacteroidales bacterium]